MTIQKQHIVIAGSGLGSLYLALLLPEDFQITFVTAGDGNDGNSFMAKGGIAFPLNDEDIECHVLDTLRAGDFHGDPGMIRSIIASAPAVLQKLKQLGVVFDDHMALEGGHSESRVHHVEDETGFKISSTLQQKVKSKPNVKWLIFHQILDVLTAEDRVIGLKLLDTQSGRLAEIRAEATILATGGVSGLFLHHTNASTIHGEGHAIGVRAGAKAIDMEFIQFHPTTLYSDNFRAHELVTEAFRGAGAYLSDLNGHRFMDDLHAMGSLAPRDIVSRNMQFTMLKQQVPYLYLNYESLTEEILKLQFPSLSNKIKHFTNHRIPVVPAAHYTCGGIATDIKGNTGVKGLFAIGELARTGLHGANRLASNSLMELLVMGDALAEYLSHRGSDLTTQTGYKLLPQWPVECIESGLVADLNMQLKHLLWNHFGIIREPEEMKKGKLKLDQLYQEVTSYLMPDMIDPNLLNLINRLETARLIATAAMSNQHACGAHYVLETKSSSNVLLN